MTHGYKIAQWLGSHGTENKKLTNLGILWKDIRKAGKFLYSAF
jgi:hypothetical protein